MRGDPPLPTFKVTLDVSADSEAVIAGYCVKFLSELGYHVMPPGKPWERVGTFCKRVGFHAHKFNELVRRFESRGGNVRLDRRGVSRRVMAMQVNPEFEQFCLATKKA